MGKVQELKQGAAVEQTRQNTGSKPQATQTSDWSKHTLAQGSTTELNDRLMRRTGEGTAYTMRKVWALTITKTSGAQVGNQQTKDQTP